MSVMNMIEALNSAHDVMMARDDDIVVLGKIKQLERSGKWDVVVVARGAGLDIPHVGRPWPCAGFVPSCRVRHVRRGPDMSRRVVITS